MHCGEAGIVLGYVAEGVFENMNGSCAHSMALAAT